MMLNIPEDKLPAEYKDSARLDSLYSPFRSHSVNPKDFESKVFSWKHLIYLYCVNNGVYSFNLALLKKVFIRHGRPPSSLSTILDELLHRGDLQYVEDFLKVTPKSWSGWVTNLLVKKPLSWSYNTVRNTLFQNQNKSDHVYVYENVIKQDVENLFANIHDKHLKKIISFSEFMKILNRDINQIDDVKLLLHYLVRELLADVRNESKTDTDSLLIKISPKNSFTPISEVDLAMYTLEKNEKIFTKCVEDLEDEIALSRKEIKAHLLKGHRQLAKTCLRKTHEIDKRLTNKINALHNVQVLLEKIKDVQGDANVLQAYKQAVAAFNSTVKEHGLTEDTIEDSMLQLGEMLDVHNDIQAVLTKPVIEDESDLEQELMELMKTEEKPDEPDELKDLDEQLANLSVNQSPIKQIATVQTSI